MTDEQLARSDVRILHFPTVLGAIVPTYNVPELPALNITEEALAGIFLGKIQKWNHYELAKANPGTILPANDIVVVHRSDGSGTTFVWTDYLSKVSVEWKDTVGCGTSVKWPKGLGAKGNEGVAGLVKQTPYSISYIELVYAIQNQMAYSRVRNSAGRFVKADVASVTAAAAVPIPADFRLSLTNSPAPDAYPISSFTWLLIRSKIADSAKRQAIIDFLRWMLTTGQAMAPGLGFAPLPPAVVAKELDAISQIN
jgi:phosphate transport system substrate-binding protein